MLRFSLSLKKTHFIQGNCWENLRFVAKDSIFLWRAWSAVFKIKDVKGPKHCLLVQKVPTGVKNIRNRRPIFSGCRLETRRRRGGAACPLRAPPRPPASGSRGRRGPNALLPRDSFASGGTDACAPALGEAALFLWRLLWCLWDGDGGSAIFDLVGPDCGSWH